jgi:hypothetical protein
MGRGLELISAMATAPSTGAAFTALTGNSLVVRAGKGASLLATWQTRQAAGFSRLTSPMLHDGSVGIQMGGPIGTTLQLVGAREVLQGQDTLALYGSGSATAGDIELWSGLVHYSDLPGVDCRLIGVAELARRLVDRVCVPNTLTTGVTGQYSGAEAISAEGDQFKADTEYALLGAVFQVAGHAVRWLGPDFGGLGIGMPAKNFDRSSDWFVWLSELSGLPLIPIVRSPNKAMTMIDAVVDENGADAVVYTCWGRLR